LNPNSVLEPPPSLCPNRRVANRRHERCQPKGGYIFVPQYRQYGKSQIVKRGRKMTGGDQRLKYEF
jgi:hypothetical protein